MAENTQRSRGRPRNYKLDRGGVPAEGGPFTGIVMSNIDPTRTGRLRVYIETFGAGNMNDDTKWTTVDYLPSFYGSTTRSGTSKGAGTYPGNSNSYGMWFTPPDVGVTVMCVFVNGDREQGYYIGVVPDQGITHMVPAIGAKTNAVKANANQEKYFANAPQLPVTEINDANTAITNSPTYYDEPKPIHSVVAAAIFQQGLINDPDRGPIGSSSQRESPSTVYGISTPGRPIFRGGFKQEDIEAKIAKNSIKPQDAEVIGRMGGHTFVMDDGDINNKDALFRLRTAKGHQITMSDSGEFFYIIHANGQSWLEFGKEGTIDLYSTNSVNVRTDGDINFHAGNNINMYATNDINCKAGNDMALESKRFAATGLENAVIYSKTYVGVKSDGTLALKSAKGSWAGGSALVFKAGGIDLNGPAAPDVTAPTAITETVLPDVTFDTSLGWIEKQDGLTSIVSRAPTHEPFLGHGKGVDIPATFESNQPSPPPGADPVPADVEITAETDTNGVAP